MNLFRLPLLSGHSKPSKLFKSFPKVLRGLQVFTKVAGYTSHCSRRGIHLSRIMAEYNVVFVLGGPGAGKGTQCENIVKVILICLSGLADIPYANAD